MANTTIKIPRAHLIMALCLPLAVLLGYFLAEPLESGSVAVIVLVMFVLAVPLLMKWHHPILVLSWNACIYPVTLPGQPQIWILAAAASLLFAALNRSVNPENRFLYVPSISNSLLFLTAVVLLTACINGGIGIRSLGGASYGGKNYVLVLMAVAGFFAFSSMRIPAERAGLYAGMFFLSGLTGIMPNLIYKLGPSFYSLFYLFPAGAALDQARAEFSLVPGIFRINGLASVGTALYCYILARYGIRGALDFSKPWRFLCLVIAVGCCATCGFRSCLLLFVVTFCAQFYFEGLHRTRLLPAVLAVCVVAGLIVLPRVDRLPWVVQRTISFLPVRVDPVVEQSAVETTEWRLNIWKQSLTLIPKYLFVGKGYSMDPNQLFLEAGPANHFVATSAEAISITSDYHNGPLSLVIPLGIWGMIGFVWFLIAAGGYLYHNYRHGPPQLQRLNTFFLAFFLTKILSFCVVFGSFHTDFCGFTGLVGLSLSLNGLPETAVESEATEPAQPALEAFS